MTVAHPEPGEEVARRIEALRRVRIPPQFGMAVTGLRDSRGLTLFRLTPLFRRYPELRQMVLGQVPDAATLTLFLTVCSVSDETERQAWLAALDRLRHPDPDPEDEPVAGSSAAEWVAITVASGVLGNVAYDGIRAVVRASWRALTRRRERARTTVTERDALLLAQAAVHRRCQRIGIEPPEPTGLDYSAYQERDGRWLLRLTDTAGRSFFVRIPPDRPAEDDVTVDVSIPHPATRRSRRPPRPG
jgi:hypothetical protein